mmetsp:Transcript_102799/g.178301  ORF Transcript_102799/g.178301 Transcript_102799/m.178301 type:complete len:123 (-) Transcript_102799:213-581(-)
MRTRAVARIEKDVRRGNQNSKTVAEIITPPARASTNDIWDGVAWPLGSRKTTPAPMTVESPAKNDMPTPVNLLAGSRPCGAKTSLLRIVEVSISCKSWRVLLRLVTSANRTRKLQLCAGTKS